jgi:hypothetical protein
MSMGETSRSPIRKLDPECMVTNSGDACPTEQGIRVSDACPDACNHLADAYVFNYGTGNLIDLTFTT